MFNYRLIVAYKKAVLSQGWPRDAAVSFGMHRCLQRHCTVLPTIALLSCTKLWN